MNKGPVNMLKDAYVEKDEDFKTIRFKRNFVDKTMMLKSLFEADGNVYLYTRPKRFGKTINQSMIGYFFDEDRPEPDLFKDLAISSAKGYAENICSSPVIRVSLKDLSPRHVYVDSGDPHAVREAVQKDFVSQMTASFRAQLSKYRRMADGSTDRIACESLARLFDDRISPDDLTSILRSLSSILSERHMQSKKCGNPRSVVILMDEYDHPIQRISDPMLYDAVLPILRDLMSKTFKGNDCMRLGVITGIMRVSKESMFSDLNNLVSRDVLTDEGNEWFGFTQEEVERLVHSDPDITERSGKTSETVLDEIRRWYNGYSFGSSSVYNPMSVNMYLASKCMPAKYWENSTGSELFESMMAGASLETILNLDYLCESLGNSVRSPIHPGMVFDDLVSHDSDGSFMLSYLLMSGYLTAEAVEWAENNDPVCDVRIPDEEVRSFFMTVRDRVSNARRMSQSLVASIYGKDALSLKVSLQKLLGVVRLDGSWRLVGKDRERHEKYRDLISTDLLLAGLDVDTEVSKGFGIADIYIPPSNGKPPVIIEVKTTSDPEKDLMKLARQALKQISDNEYSKEPMDAGAIAVGIGLHMKNVDVAFSLDNGPAGHAGTYRRSLSLRSAEASGDEITAHRQETKPLDRLRTGYEPISEPVGTDRRLHFLAESSLLRLFQVIMALWITVRLPTTANHSIMTSSQLTSNPSTSKDPYPTADMAYWTIGNMVERTTLSARPSSPAYRRGAPMAWACVPMYDVSSTPIRASIPR